MSTFGLSMRHLMASSNPHPALIQPSSSLRPSLAQPLYNPHTTFVQSLSCPHPACIKPSSNARPACIQPTSNPYPTAIQTSFNPRPACVPLPSWLCWAWAAPGLCSHSGDKNHAVAGRKIPKGPPCRPPATSPPVLVILS